MRARVRMPVCVCARSMNIRGLSMAKRYRTLAQAVQGETDAVREHFSRAAEAFILGNKPEGHASVQHALAAASRLQRAREGRGPGSAAHARATRAKRREHPDPNNLEYPHGETP